MAGGSVLRCALAIILEPILEPRTWPGSTKNIERTKDL